MKKPTPKKSPTRKKTVAEAHAALAKGAKEIDVAKGVIDNTIPEIEEVEADVKSLIKKCVILDAGNRGLALNEDTTAGEAVKLFDYFVDQSESVQFIIGDLILAMEKLPAFKVRGESKFTQAMLASGRSLDSCKAYRSVSLHTPPELRLLPYTQTRATLKIPKLEDRKAVIEEAAKLATEGKLPTVEEMMKKADAFAPRKKKGSKNGTTPPSPGREPTDGELVIVRELEDNGGAFLAHLEMSAFVHEIDATDTARLREIVKRIHSAHLQFTA